MRRLFLILDDYSEIEQTSLVMFCDLIVNTLHNNSDNFVKLKISAYPGRVELGELDRQKVDIRYLDYFQLYAGDKRNEMESMAVAYTERLMDTRLKIYTGKDFDYKNVTDYKDITIKQVPMLIHVENKKIDHVYYKASDIKKVLD